MEGRRVEAGFYIRFSCWATEPATGGDGGDKACWARSGGGCRRGGVVRLLWGWWRDTPPPHTTQQLENPSIGTPSMASSGRLGKKWLCLCGIFRRKQVKEEQKSIWILTSKRDVDGDPLEYVWYSLNPEDPKLTSGCPLLDRAPLPQISNTLFDHAVFTISGPRIYVLGGYLDRVRKIASADVYYIDRGGSESSSCWIKGTPMLYPRVKPTCSIVDGKVYVCGGLHYQRPGMFDIDKDDEPFGEVYDPTTEKWEALPEIPDDEDFLITSYATVVSMTATVVGGDGKRYIPVHLYGSQKLMGLRLDDNSWFCVAYNFDRNCRNMVVVDDVIYYICAYNFDCNCRNLVVVYDAIYSICAYHLPTKQFLRVVNNLTIDLDSRLFVVGHNSLWLYEENVMSFVNFKVHKNYNGSNLDSVSFISVSSGKFRVDCDAYHATSST